MGILENERAPVTNTILDLHREPAPLHFRNRIYSQSPALTAMIGPAQDKNRCTIACANTWPSSSGASGDEMYEGRYRAWPLFGETKTDFQDPVEA